MSRTVFGSLEAVDITSLGVQTIAKIDTGAWSGTLHCTDIHVDNGVLYFSPLGDAELASSTAKFESRLFRSASGHTEERYLIPVDIVIKGQKYHTTLGIGDRNDMSREMLLGRKFLLENDILVDVSLTIDRDTEAERFL